MLINSLRHQRLLVVPKRFFAATPPDYDAIAEKLMARNHGPCPLIKSNFGEQEISNAVVFYHLFDFVFGDRQGPKQFLKRPKLISARNYRFNRNEQLKDQVFKGRYETTGFKVHLAFAEQVNLGIPADFFRDATQSDVDALPDLPEFKKFINPIYLWTDSMFKWVAKGTKTRWANRRRIRFTKYFLQNMSETGFLADEITELNTEEFKPRKGGKDN